jgi:hypothetical protein
LSITVDTLIDELDGSIVDGDISLRDAIAAAPPGETIGFDGALTSSGSATIQLTDQLTVDKDLTISGPGSHLLTLRSTSRKFNIDDGTAADISVAIFGMTLTGGNLLGVGAGIRNAEDLILADSTVTGNVTSSRTFFRYTYVYDGGGIWNSGDLTIVRSTISNNSASQDGGGIANTGMLTITDSSITGNVARALQGYRSIGFGGGGIFCTSYSTVTVTNSTISGNSTLRGGGGMLAEGSAATVLLASSTISGNSAGSGGGIRSSTELSIIGSTISGNTASSRGGGVYNSDDQTTIEFSTITLNQAPAGAGSGVASYGDSYTRTRVQSSIIAGNVASDVDFIGSGSNSFRSQGYNLIGTGNALGRFNVTLDRTGITDPVLDQLTDNGGPTRTHALRAGSPAIDSGNPSAVAGSGGVPMFDQRGTPYGRVYNGDGTGGARIDIGAFELHPIVVPTLPGDYNASGTVDAADYVIWRKTLSSQVTAHSGADGSGNGVIDPADHDVWRANFGTSLSASAAASASSAAAATTTGSLYQSRDTWLPADIVFTMLGEQVVAGGAMFAPSKAAHSALVGAVALVDPPLFVQPPRERPMPTDAESLPAKLVGKTGHSQCDTAEESAVTTAGSVRPVAPAPLQFGLVLRDVSGRRGP